MYYRLKCFHGWGCGSIGRVKLWVPSPTSSEQSIIIHDCEHIIIHDCEHIIIHDCEHIIIHDCEHIRQELIFWRDRATDPQI